jgi:hypothetical protein
MAEERYEDRTGGMFYYLKELFSWLYLLSLEVVRNNRVPFVLLEYLSFPITMIDTLGFLIKYKYTQNEELSEKLNYER